MNVNSAFLDQELGATAFDVKRITYYPNSSTSPSVVTSTGVMGSIHPAAPEMLELLPEEERNEEYIYIHTEFALQLGKFNGETTTAPDRIIWNEKTWRVVRIRDWSSFGFYEALAVRMQEEETDDSN